MGILRRKSGIIGGDIVTIKDSYFKRVHGHNYSRDKPYEVKRVDTTSEGAEVAYLRDNKGKLHPISTKLVKKVE